MSELEPSDYSTTLEELKSRVHAARLRVQRRANNELLQLWWHVGQTIRTRRSQEAWGTNVLDRLARDLRTEFPTMKGFSAANLRYMRRFAEAWPDLDAIRQRPVGELPWGHVIELLDKLDDGWKPFWLDTVAAAPEGITRVAFVADNPGKWLIESQTAAAWFEVV